MTEPVVLRALRVFHGDLSPHLQSLHATFDDAWSRYGEASYELAVLASTIWGSDDVELHRALLPRLAELSERVTRASRDQEDVVQVATVLRSGQLFPPFEEPLPVLRTAAAILDGNRDLEALQTRFTDEDRKKIRRRRS